jgi:hypothetical protein
VISRAEPRLFAGASLGHEEAALSIMMKIVHRRVKCANIIAGFVGLRTGVVDSDTTHVIVRTSYGKYTFYNTQELYYTSWERKERFDFVTKSRTRPGVLSFMFL